MLFAEVNKIKIHFDTSLLCCGVVHLFWWRVYEKKFNYFCFYPGTVFCTLDQHTCVAVFLTTSTAHIPTRLLVTTRVASFAMVRVPVRGMSTVGISARMALILESYKTFHRSTPTMGLPAWTASDWPEIMNALNTWDILYIVVGDGTWSEAWSFIYLKSGVEDSGMVHHIKEMHEISEGLKPFYLWLHVDAVILHSLTGHHLWRKMFFIKE